MNRRNFLIAAAVAAVIRPLIEEPKRPAWLKRISENEWVMFGADWGKGRDRTALALTSYGPDLQLRTRDITHWVWPHGHADLGIGDPEFPCGGGETLFRGTYPPDEAPQAKLTLEHIERVVAHMKARGVPLYEPLEPLRHGVLGTYSYPTFYEGPARG